MDLLTDSLFFPSGSLWIPYGFIGVPLLIYFQSGEFPSINS